MMEDLSAEVFHICSNTGMLLFPNEETMSDDTIEQMYKELCPVPVEQLSTTP